MKTHSDLLRFPSIYTDADIDECMDEAPIINATKSVMINSNPLVNNKGNISPDDIKSFRNEKAWPKNAVPVVEQREETKKGQLDIKILKGFKSSNWYNGPTPIQGKRSQEDYLLIRQNFKASRLAKISKSDWFTVKKTSLMSSFEILKKLRGFK